MSPLRSYETTLEKLLNRSGSSDPINSPDSEIECHLNGGTSAYVQSNLDGKFLKNSGIFFTDKKRGDKLVKKLICNSTVLSIPVLDPTCGAGDLLLSCATYFPLKSTLLETLNLWGTLVYGYDIHPEFVSIAKKRLVLLAAQRTQQSAKGLDTSIFFHDIKSRDFLQDTPELRGDFHIIANPPFHAQNAPDNFRFSSGKTNSAALILHKCIEIIPTNCRIAAILPDVIRSGSRYETLLQDVRSKLAYSKISVEGKFSKDVDIDIFIISGRKRSVQKPYQKSQDVINGTIQDNFKVSVGAVVPHRHVEEGKRFPYLTAKDIKLNANTSSSSNTLRFTGTVFEPPFIALKRTSSPSDRNRICASIVEGQEPYAVENHVLVLKPKDNSIKSCLSLLFHLKSDSCKDWINQRIRCRHLTVASVKNIPSKFPHEHRPSGPRKRSRR